ncbi:MAG: hypothetical protein CL677_03965 [Bdellovibrionaceae bacterium]|nr:hypothetical protein [Pseudobdellovibrionaceae bacterium]|tara:strand:- start:30699 stop:31088 length:390 start_codon:yes stop_codon:yes gene_type:complete
MQASVISISRKGVLTLGEVQQILPIIKKITTQIKDDVDRLMQALEGSVENPVKTADIESKINFKLDEWNSKITRLGGITKGLWLVDFDSGDGFYCWKHPEPDIMFWHAYNEGFKGRVPIRHKIQVDHNY